MNCPMKTYICVVLLIVSFAAQTFAQPDTTHRVRRADSLMSFFVGSWGPFDKQPFNHANKFGIMGQADNSFRYYNLEDSLGMNAEVRGIWDNPLREPAPKDTTLGGRRGQHLDMLSVEPFILHHALNNAFYMRFEFERHTQGAAGTEYPGFLTRAGLTGTDVNFSGATFPKFLIGSGRDTSENAVKLDTDAVGIFADTMWNIGLFDGPTDASHQYYGKNTSLNPFSRKMLMRIRVKVNEPVSDSTKILFISTRNEMKSNGTVIRTHKDTIRVDSRFSHIDSDFDNIDIRFLRDTLTQKIGFSFFWPKQVNAVFDYMELMNAHVDTTDSSHIIRIEIDGAIGDDGIHAGLFGAYSAEDFLSPNPIELNKLVDNIIDSFQGHINYIRVGDEFPWSQALPLKRLTKLMRERSGGAIEIAAFTVDSIAWFNEGLPSIHDYFLEGRKKGWVDTNYADPKMVFFDPYSIRNLELPKRIRTPASNSDSLHHWEDIHITTGSSDGSHPSGLHYTREKYLQTTQWGNINYSSYLAANRKARRWTERQHDSSKYAILWQAGAGMRTQRDADTNHVTRPIWLKFDELRPPTGPEMKMTGHMATSCGASGLLFYLLIQAPPANGGATNGGIMMDDGTHDSMYYTTTVKNDTGGLTSGRMWMGFKERYDTVRALIPILIKHGNMLLNDTCIGDWTAAELPNIPDSSKDKLSFFANPVRSIDDFGTEDAFHANSGITPDSSNRTFVHISMWLDKDSAAKANHIDTLLYITNMRTDDSYDTTEVPSTIDRRVIALTLKTAHFVKDVIDKSSGLALDSTRVGTPFVGEGNELQVRLLAGDGILVRLMPPPVDTTLRQMQVAINYPKGTQSFFDYGRVRFDKAVLGVKDPASNFTVPSSPSSFVGVRDVDTVKLWQDSLIYIKVDNSNKTRVGRWRQQSWDRAETSPFFKFENTTFPAYQKNRQISTDSLAHSIVIRTDMEGFGNYGHIRFKDPFFVDSATLLNVYDTLIKTNPFLPHILSAGRGLGADTEHYGGVFLMQNPRRDSAKPIYSLQAYDVVKSDDHRSLDTIPFFTDWTFMGWAANDTTIEEDVYPWKNGPDSWRYVLTPTTDVIFSMDSAIYIARYKAHMAAYTESTYNPDDSGNCCNNQRKLFYDGKDSVGRNKYRFVYSSAGRIYTVLGTKTGTNDNAIEWGKEELISSWNSGASHYPAIGYHPKQWEKYHYVFQDDENGEIKFAFKDSLHGLQVLTLANGVEVNPPYSHSLSTPVIASTDFASGPVNVIAWADEDGIHLKGTFYDNNADMTSTINLGDPTAFYPTIWIDTCYYCTDTVSKAKFIVAWQQDIDTGGITVTDILARRYEIIFSDSAGHKQRVIQPLGGTPGNLMNVSRSLTPASINNRRPCISGFHVTSGGSSGAAQYKIAYEVFDTTLTQGIEIGNLVANNGASSWTNTNYLTSGDAANEYWKPSIEITKYHKADTGLVLKSNWYSLVHEMGGGGHIEHWAFDGNSQRLGSNIFDYIIDPQIAVTPAKIDSDLYRMGQSTGADPRWMVSGYTATYKLGTNDTLWGYHILTQKDTGSELVIQSGIGELAVDAGSGFHSYDLNDRDDTLHVDSLHPNSYFMQSEPFTLPAGGSMQYCAWVRPSDDSLRKAVFSNIKYALDFYDTSGAFYYRIDSLELTDSINRIHSELRTVPINTDSNKTGYAVFHSISDATDGINAMPNNMITKKRLSTINAYKRGSSSIARISTQIRLWTSPNPFRDEVNVFFDIPVSGGVTIEAFNILGNSMGYLCKDRRFTDGKHQFVWKAQKLLPGVYILRMRYGNEVISTRIISIE